jgi:hypothetical protein
MNYNLQVLFIVNDELDIINEFSHIIKKKNINIFINKLEKNIKGEECENNINIFKNISELQNIIFNYVIIHDISSYTFLDDIKNIINNNTLIYIYTSLSNENLSKINFKNYIRKYIKKNYNPIFSLQNIIKYIENKNYEIISLKIHKSNNYIIYGNNNIYEIIIKCV